MIGAVFVNYNAGPELRLALASVDKETGGAWHGVVVDNGSTDGSEQAALEFPQVRLLRNGSNVGFGRGVNQAMAECPADRILVMNPDCQLMPGALTLLNAVLDADATCAIAAPKILDPDGSPQGNARGDPDMLTGLFGRTGALRRALSGLEVSRRNVIVGTAAENSIQVDWVSGACMLLRREAFVRAGGFDRRYFMYWEDADLCRRLRAHGFSIRFVPAATAVHRVGQSSRTARGLSIRAFHDSAYLYYSTHVAPGRLNPKRWVARVILTIRCWWKLASSA